jgi:hypothetical protein
LEELGVPPKSSQKRPRKPQKRHLPNSEAQRKFDLDVMAFLLNCNLHYSFLETKGFKHFVSVSNQNYSVKSPRTMSKRIAPLLHKILQKAMQEVLEKELPECHNVALTYLAWERFATKGGDEDERSAAVLGLSIHYINKSFEFRKFALAVDILDYSSDEDYARKIDEMLERVPCNF